VKERPTPALVSALRDARRDAGALASALRRPFELCAITCSYDTAFEPIAEQVRAKLAELRSVFPDDGPVRLRLVVVDDTGAPGFAEATQAAFSEAVPWLRDSDRLSCVRLPLDDAAPWGRRSLAVRAALDEALSREPDAVLQINLNLKVHAAQAATGLRALLDSGAEAAIGSRAFADGGRQAGAGLVGRAKSVAYNRLVHAALPPLSAFGDIGSPMKVISARAARVIARRSRIDSVGFEAEWLAILDANDLPAVRFGILWQQRAGSRPPLEKSGRMLADLAQVRRAWRRGQLREG
jgi:hypothetical protein